MKHRYWLAVFLMLFAQNAGAACLETCSVKDYVTTPKQAGTFTVHGFITSKFQCPPCPQGAMCEPCAPDSITLADKKECVDHACDVTLRVAVNDPVLFKEFTVGQEVLVTMTVETKVQRIEDYHLKEGTKTLLQKEPGLLERNPAEWLKKHYENP